MGFAACILITSSPFERLWPAPPDGRDLNPVLRGWGNYFRTGNAGCLDYALDGIHDLVKAHKIAAEAINRVVVNTSRLNTTILKNHRPQTGLEAKFSIEFAMAAPVTKYAKMILNPEDVRFELEKAFYELRYELDHRPDYVALPVRSIVELLNGVPT